MSFEEVLMNLLGARSKWFLQFEIENGRGIVAIQGGKIVFAELTYEGELLEGREAVKKIMEASREVKDIELQPLEGTIESNVDIDQFELLSLLEGEKEFTEPEVEVEEFFEKKEGAVTEVCLSFFSRNSVKLVAINEEVEINNLSLTKGEIEKIVKTYKDLKEEMSNMNFNYLTFTCEKLLGIVIFSGEKTALILLDSEEKANFELDEPEIVEKLKQAVQSS
ncbi:hypothetical protein SAMN06265339_1717 [Desulfurobacterium pacificum]|uniref:DUF4388 domain-containing protein n=1 Tax=Desulfurobacterium pacificum TaxID=240166 RepID=A0ABY1NWJ6_9BACT|nr:hypothetical protein [Desulfurobacterium pacificum]SMP20016.1 hypothetical protein SAMN06265339_1717 [Desulfurobacterium pacificum]